MATVLTYLKYFVEHMKDLLIDHCNPILRARYFGVIFDQVPSYAEINCGTTEIEKIPGVNELFKLAHSKDVSLVRTRGLEPPRAQCSPAPQADASTNSATSACNVASIVYCLSGHIRSLQVYVGLRFLSTKIVGLLLV